EQRISWIVSGDDLDPGRKANSGLRIITAQDDPFDACACADGDVPCDRFIGAQGKGHAFAGTIDGDGGIAAFVVPADADAGIDANGMQLGGAWRWTIGCLENAFGRGGEGGETAQDEQYQGGGPELVRAVGRPKRMALHRIHKT